MRLYTHTHTDILKNNRGITLVALVVTIVVLLILASVSINLVLGQNGLITQAQEAKRKTEEVEQKENQEYKNLESEMYENLKIADLSKYKIGDYVKYEYDNVEKGYNLLKEDSGYTDNQIIKQDKNMQWKILRKDEVKGTIYIVSEYPTEEGVQLSGKTGYNYGTKALNETCKNLYSNAKMGLEARSINLADYESDLTEKGFYIRNNYKGNFAKYGEAKTHLENKFYPSLYEEHLGAGINSDGVKQIYVDNSVDPYKESYIQTEKDEIKEADTELTATETCYAMSVYYENFKEIYKVMNFYPNNQYEWIATGYVENFDDYVRFGMRIRNQSTIVGWKMFDSNKSIDGLNAKLRPVVEIPYNLFEENKDENDCWNLHN